MGEERECFCGETIRQLGSSGDSDRPWFDHVGNDRCYPNDPNPVDAAAKHEPMDPPPTPSEGER